MPLTLNKDYGYSYSPSYSTPTAQSYSPRYTRNVTIPTALKQVAIGEMNAVSVFNQFPLELTKVINDLCEDSLGRKFENLLEDEQKNVFYMLLVAQENTKEVPGAGAPTTNSSAISAMLNRSATPPLFISVPVCKSVPGPNIDLDAMSTPKKWWQFWR